MRRLLGRLRFPPRALVALLPVVAAVGLLGQRAAAPGIVSRVIDAPQLLDDLRVLSADDMEGRAVGTPGGEKARAFIVARFKAVGIAPFGQDYTQPFALTNGRKGSGANVIGQVEGSRRPQRYIVVSAHYDHIGVSKGQVFNGANDNASGTAALLALGRHFSAQRPVNSIIFAAFDGEEIGLLGARAFLKAPPVDRAALAINVNADMIGRDGNNRLYVVGTARQPFLKPYIERVAARVPVRLIMGQEDWLGDSDQQAFIEAGVPALYLGVEDASQHHRSTDDYETMTYRFYVSAVETLIEVVRELDANLDAIAKR